MIHIWHTVIRSNNHSSLSVDFFKIPNREKHKIGRLYFINGLSPSHIMENTKFFSLLKIKRKPSKKLPVVLGLKHPRSAFYPIFRATFVETLEKDCFASFVLFCLLCQGRIEKNFKLIENFVSARRFHMRHLINISISFKEKKL